MLTLHGTLVDSKLVGADIEYAPRLAVWGSWGAHKISRMVPLVGTEALGTFALPALGAARGDEALWFKLIVKTQHSGIDDIDAVERGHVARDLQAGCLRVPLADVLNGHTTHVFERPLIDPTLRAVAFAANGGDAAAADTYALKARLRLGVTFADVTPAALTALGVHMRSALNAGKSASGDLLYGTPAQETAMIAARDMLIGAYAVDFYGGDDAQTGAHVVEARFPVGPEKTLADLHLAAYNSEFGVLPPVAFVQQTPDMRELPASERAPAAAAALHAHYGPTIEGARYMERMLGSSLVRHGLSAARFCAAIDAQHTQSRSDANFSTDYLRSLRVIADAATFAANSVHYTKDMRYPNRDVLAPEAIAAAAAALPVPAHAHAPAPAPQLTARRRPLAMVALKKSGTMVPVAAVAWTGAASRGLFRADTATATPTGGAGTPAPVAPKLLEVELESFDATLQYGQSNSGDCEDSGCLAGMALRSVPALAAAGGAATPLLQNAAAVCARRLVLDCAASVTAAYVNTEGAVMTKEEAAKAIADLPMIGDAIDLRATCGGHCHGVWIGRVVVGDMLTRAGHNVAVELPGLLAGFAQTAADTRAPVTVLEGTSSVEDWVLPAGEVARALVPDGGTALAFEREAAARRALVKTVRATAPALLEHVKIEGLSFYTGPLATTERRVSGFYRGLAHGMSAELYALNPLFGQLTFVDPVKQTRGLEISGVLRAPLRPDGAAGVGLRATFAGVGRTPWDTEVRPVMACLQNQMPYATTLTRFAAPADFDAAMLRTGHVLNDAVMGALAHTPTPELGTALLRHASGLAARQFGNSSAGGAVLGSGLLLGANATPALAPVATATTTLCLYTAPWRLARPGATEAVRTSLAALTASGTILGHAFLHDRPLAASDDVITIVLTLPVASG